MNVDLVRIGNSRGVRIPKPIIEQCGFGDRVRFEVEGDRLIIGPAEVARAGWDDAFAGMAAAGDDAPLLPDDLDPGSSDAPWQW
jgi:antitoxin MazE